MEAGAQSASPSATPPESAAVEALDGSLQSEAVEAVDPLPEQWYGHPPCILASRVRCLVHIPTPQSAGDGSLVVQPGVQIRAGGPEAASSASSGAPLRPRTPQRPAVFRLSSLREVFGGPTPDVAPAPHLVPQDGDGWSGDELTGEAFAESSPAEPMFARALTQAYFGSDRRAGRWDRFMNLFRQPLRCDAGVGRERLIYAPFEIDVSQPLASNIRLRFDAAYNQIFPDRAEFFYGKGKINTLSWSDA